MGLGSSWWDNLGDSPEAAGPGRSALEAVPEVLEAGFLPRGGSRPGLAALAAGPAAGFGSSNELDTMPPCVTLAGFADDVTGPDGRCGDAPDDQLIGVLRAWDRLESWTAARKLSVIAELIRRRPAPGCQPGGPGGLPAGWGKFCGDELAAATATSGQAADKTLTLAYDLTSRLPGTARALHEGTITLYKARIIADATHILDPADAAAAEALALREVAGKTPGQLRAAIARAVTTVNPAAAQARREKAQRDARVELWREDAGTAALCGRDLPPAEALAADQRITTYARELRAAGLDGTLDQLRARAFLDLTLGVRSHPERPQNPGDLRAGQGSSSGPRTGKPGEGNTRGGAVQSATSAGARAPGTETAGARAPGTETPGTETPRAGGGAGATGKDGTSKDGGDEDGTGRNGGDDGLLGNRIADQGSAGGTGPVPGIAARINLTIPLTTLLGLAERPGEADGLGAIDPALARILADSAAANPRTTWCVTVTDEDGHPTAHGCARPTKGRRVAGSEPPAESGRPSRAEPNDQAKPNSQNRSSSRDTTGSRNGPSSQDRSSSRDTTGGRNGPSSQDGPSSRDRTGGRCGTAFIREQGSDSAGGYGRWRLRAGAGREFLIGIEPLAILDCDHRHESAGYEPSDKLRHLVEIRDGECTWPPCRRAARRCDFEHAIPWDRGGRTCTCNAGARCRHHHQAKQAHGWHLEQKQPGHHTWTTPAERTYTTGPTQYPV
jgi:Domain of unknown function (DUF222)